MRKLLAAAALSVLFSVAGYSQGYPAEWDEYLTPKYYYSLKHEVNKAGGSGAECVEALLAAARRDIASQIKVNVQTVTQFKDHDVNGQAETEYTSSVSFSSDVTLRFVETRTFYDKRKKTGYALAFLSKKDLQDIYDARAGKVTSMLKVAENAEAERKFDVALKYNYWALLLNSTLPPADQPEYGGEPAQWYSRSAIERILDGIKFTFTGRSPEDNLLGLFDVTFEGEPVTTLDYTVNDGLGESGVLQARDGVGPFEFRANMDIRNVDVRVEYTYEDESISDPEMKLALGEVGRIRFADAYKTGIPVKDEVPKTRRQIKKAQEAIEASAANELAREVNSGFAHTKFSEVRDSAYYIRTINRVLDGLIAKDYESCVDLFSKEGFDTYTRLLNYGNARVIKRGPVKLLNFDGNIYCRSIPMMFSFGNNYKSFMENVVFSFNSEGLINDVTFGLESESLQDILSKTKWEDDAKMVLINFLEGYKTAFALMNIDHISSIFSDDALIITGKRVVRTVIEGGIQLQGEAFEYNRQTKAQYIRNLERSFRSKEYINLKFSNVSVLKTTRGTNTNLYGIQVKQDYFSSNYGDSGYLYLLVDISDQARPLIHVRTWQPEPDPDFGIYGINNL
ncbi:MAG: hypothetical protein IKO04_06885 [Bacteroidales bacterium]|nr:hypothetical protein [Bacteroidales bacterium]